MLYEVITRERRAATRRHQAPRGGQSTPVGARGRAEPRHRAAYSQLRRRGEPPVPDRDADGRVITSYSIHYTKLYEGRF